MSLTEDRTGHGWVNAHTHVYSGLVPLGMPAPKQRPRNFAEILERVWWRMDRALDEASLRAAARLYAAEALLSGTSALVDHHESPEFIEGSLDVVADSCQELGLRAVLCYGATERNGGREEAQRGLKESRRFIETNERPLVRGVVGLHASFTVSDDTLCEAGALARSLGTVVHVHMAEDDVDVHDALERGYRDPLDRLVRLDALPRGSILAHGVHLGPEAVSRCAELGLWIVQNPRSNRSNGVGYPRALQRSQQVALGTDGYPADMVDEAEMLIIEAAAHGEALEGVLERLDAGGRLIDERFGEKARNDVEVGQGSVVVQGRMVVRDGQLQGFDMDEIRAHAQEEASRLWKRMEGL